MVVKYLGDTSGGDFPLIEIPYFLSKVRVGWPSPADDYVERPIDLNEHLIKNPAATYFVRVSGDSMIDACIGDGAILVVDRSVEAKHKNIVIADINGSYSCKRLLIKPKVCLASENDKYPPIFIEENEELQAIGVVIAAINTY